MADQPSRPRHLWRTLWRLAAGDRSLAVILIGMAVTLALVLAIPQLPPTLSETGPWLAQVRARFGPAMPVLNALGLFSMGNSPLFRFLLALLALSLLVRAVDRAVELSAGRRAADPDSEAAWRALAAKDETVVRRRLSKRGYRVVPSTDGALQADRWPIAEALALLAHLGPILIIIGLLVGVVWGWRINRLEAQPGEAIEIAGRGAIVVPELAAGGQARVDGVRLYAEGEMPEVIVTAVGAGGDPLGLIETPDARPSGSLVFRLSDEAPSTYFAIPDEALFVRLTLDPEAEAGADAPLLFQVFRIRSGEQIAAGTLSGSSEGLETAEGIEIEIERQEYLVVTAIHDPGYWIKLIGILVTAAGVMGRVFWSPRGLWVRAGPDGPEGYGRLPRWAIEPADDRKGIWGKSTLALRFLGVALTPFVAGAALWSLVQEGVLWGGTTWQVAVTATWLVVLGLWLITTE